MLTPTVLPSRKTRVAKQINNGRQKIHLETLILTTVEITILVNIQISSRNYLARDLAGKNDQGDGLVSEVRI